MSEEMTQEKMLIEFKNYLMQRNLASPFHDAHFEDPLPNVPIDMPTVSLFRDTVIRQQDLYGTLLAFTCLVTGVPVDKVNTNTLVRYASGLEDQVKQLRLAFDGEVQSKIDRLMRRVDELENRLCGDDGYDD